MASLCVWRRPCAAAVPAARRGFTTHATQPMAARTVQASPEMQTRFARDGFVVVPDLLDMERVQRVRGRFEALFAGAFETGVYPDEWHWRKGISRDDAFREIVNAWKSDLTIAEVCLDPGIAALVSHLMGWAEGARLAQDDVLHKPPGASGVGFHQDSAYISTQFRPVADNSATVWIALDAADNETGVVQYAVGSHLWTAQADSELSTAESSFHGGGDHLAPVYEAARAAGIPASSVELSGLSVPAGSAVIHHQNTWHGSAPSTSTTRHRRALGVHLLRRDVTFRAAPHPDYIYGRYKLPGSSEVTDCFFPVVHSPADGHTTPHPFRP